MTVKPKSESIFEEFCCANNIPCEKIPEGEQPTPDYKIVLNTETIFVEVKQIDKDDKFTTVSGSRTVSDHVRAKINEARRQLKVALNNRSPGILLIYNNLDPLQAFGTERHDFIAAMYGELTVVFNLKKNTITESYHGQNQSLRERKNNSFSAIGSIYQTKEGPTVVLYENVFAECGLNYSSLPDCIEHVRIELT